MDEKERTKIATEISEKTWGTEGMKSFVELKDGKIPQELLEHISKELKEEEILIDDKSIKFDEGLSNLNYMLRNSKRKYLLRFKSKGNGNIFATLKREYEMLKVLQENNIDLGPKVYLFDDSKKHVKFEYIVMEFVEGKCTQQMDPKKAGETLRKLHRIQVDNLKGDSSPSCFDIGKMRCYSTKVLIADYNEIIEKWVHETSLEVLSEEEAKDVIKLYDEVIDSTRGFLIYRDQMKKNFITHRDAHPLNMIWNEKCNKCTLIDWETVHLNTYTIDVASYSVFLTDSDEQLFLSGYGIIDDAFGLILQHLETLTGCLGFYINIFKVANTSGLTLPNVGNANEIKIKLSIIIKKLSKKLSEFKNFDKKEIQKKIGN